MKKPLIILTGPTAVGKTAASIGLAKAIGGEIISADSMQVYRHMDIGSAKIRPKEMQGISHHLIDVPVAYTHLCRTFCVWSTDAGVDKKCSGRSLCTWYFFRSFSRSGMCHHHRLFSFCRRIRNHVWSNLRSGPGNCIIHGDCNI